ncbi:MAG: DNA recombination protein RmuC [Kiritimatiellia bacterium]|nr:DNA recombination protein RmuC [Kiritimatiellia bacterium]
MEWILAITLLVLIALFGALPFLRASSSREADRILREELRAMREESARDAERLRGEIARRDDESSKRTVDLVHKFGVDQQARLDGMIETLRRLETAHREESLGNRKQLEEQFRHILESNEKKLDEMRRTVDEKLQSTLERRLGESFKLVGDRLEAVQKGLGEMRSLAGGVGDLKRVLTNVKERGTWGEYQLGAILEQVLTPDQYARNVRTGAGGEQVEFAVKLPGRGTEGGDPVWLPIDSKFPREDYERLVDASRAADAEGVSSATDALARAIRKSAKDIHDKYLQPPRTTDFAILFLPTEGLYAEVLRQPGLHDELQRVHRILVAGPTTLSAILNSLRIGFQTLAIEHRSHEVWAILGAVKSEFGKFGDLFTRLRNQLNTASRTLDDGDRRTRVMANKLRGVEDMPAVESERILGLHRSSDAEDEEPGIEV